MDLIGVFKWVASLPSVNTGLEDSGVFVGLPESLSTIDAIYHGTTIAARPLLADAILTLQDHAVAGGWNIERVTDADYSGVQFKRGETVYELEGAEVQRLYYLLQT